MDKRIKKVTKKDQTIIKPKRGEIYWVELDPVRGSEIKKIRPCLIISNDIQNEVSKRVMVIPLTTSQNLPPAPFHISLIFDGKEAKILLEQMRVADKSRLKKTCLGKIVWETLQQVEKALHLTLDLKN